MSPGTDRPDGAPLLHGATITIEGRHARRWVSGLLEHLSGAAADGDARPGSRARPGQVDAAVLLEAAICQDDARLDAQAAIADADPHALRVVAQMAALPLLQACGRAIGGEAPAPWLKGYCPVCGAWPALSEFRGLERKRWLRCGRCGAGWEMPWLWCAFCDETNHEQLGYLTPAEGEPTRRAEVCYRCKGYLKALATVRALPEWGVLLEDLTTVSLDVAALDRGYHRPERPGYAPEVRILTGSGGFWSRSLGRGGRAADP